MRRLIVALGLLLCAILPAQAQTTTFTTDCSSQITITGGLALTQNGTPTTGIWGCRANVGKWWQQGNGLDYYEFTLVANTASQGAIVGFTSAPSPQVSGADNTASALSAEAGANMFSVGLNILDGNMYWNNGHTTGGSAMTVGKTAEIVLNRLTTPQQIWGTTDALNLVCNGSGGAGSTKPKYNGSCANDPSIPGSGIPLSGATGLVNNGPFLPGYQWFPYYTGQSTASASPLPSITFNFGATTFVGTVPAGYDSFNTNDGGATAPNPGPTNPQTIVVEPAPVYSNGATITVGNPALHVKASRLLGGPGCDTAGNTRGSNCWAWQALNAGTTSASGDPVATWSCPTPANTGGLYATSGFGGASTETDNGITFVCLYKIDYQTLSEAANDTATAWAASTGYVAGTYVRVNGELFFNNNASGTCTSGGSFPSGPYTTFTTYSDTGCTAWVSVGPDIYSSAANILPHQIAPASATLQLMEFNWNAKIILLDGGHDRPISYWPGMNNETLPILFARHDDFGVGGDAAPYAMGAYGSGVLGANALGSNVAPVISVVPAPGDGINNISPSSGPLAFNPNFGVTFYSNYDYGAGPVNTFTSIGEVFACSDSYMQIGQAGNGFHIVSADGEALPCHGTNLGPGYGHANAVLLRGNLIDSGIGRAAIECDGGCEISDNAVVSRSLTSAAPAIDTAYPGAVFHNTGLGPSSTNGIFAEVDNFIAPIFTSFYNDNASFGFNCPYAFGAAQTNTGSHNATDQASTPASCSASFTSSIGVAVTGGALPGTSVNGATAANNLVNATLRPSPVVPDGLTSGTGTGTSKTINITTAYSNELVLVCVNDNGVASSSGLTINGTAATLAGRGGSSPNPIEMYYAVESSPLSNAPIVVSYGSATSAIAIQAWGIPFVNTSSPLAGSVVTTTGASPVISTTGSNDVAVACSRTTSTTPTAGWHSIYAANFSIAQAKAFAVAATSISTTPSTGSNGAIAAAINLTADPIDLRIKSASAAIYGAGGAFSVTTAGSFYGTFTNNGTPDILDTTRPISGRYDIGAEQFVPATAPSGSSIFGTFGANDNEDYQYFGLERRVASKILRGGT